MYSFLLNYICSFWDDILKFSHRMLWWMMPCSSYHLYNLLITRCQNMLYNDSIQASAFFAKKLEWIFDSKGTKVDHIFCSNSRKLGNCRLIILCKVYQNYKDGRSCRASFIITSYVSEGRLYIHFPNGTSV
jgi:hypothetical protein